MVASENDEAKDEGVSRPDRFDALQLPIRVALVLQTEFRALGLAFSGLRVKGFGYTRDPCSGALKRKGGLTQVSIINSPLNTRFQHLSHKPSSLNPQASNPKPSNPQTLNPQTLNPQTLNPNPKP